MGKEPLGFRVEVAWMAVRNSDGAKERGKFAVWMQVAGPKRNGARTVADQLTGSRSDRGDPLGNIVWVAD